MQTARRLVKGPDTAETSNRHLALGADEPRKSIWVQVGYPLYSMEGPG